MHNPKLMHWGSIALIILLFIILAALIYFGRGSLKFFF
ncbi:MAG: Hypothetical protein AJITA_01396 [Acetilactobacillus jinshanensis]